MDYLENNQIIKQHNDLIKSVADMNTACLKIFEITVAKLAEHNEDNRVILSKDTIFSILNVKGHSRNSYLRNILKELRARAVFHFLPTKENGERETIISPITKIEWGVNDDTVTISFNSEIIPYLKLLDQNFTQYKLKSIASFNSKYSIVLYKYLLMYFNQYEYYRLNNKRNKEQLYALSHPIISVKELRRLTNTIKSYSYFSMFDRNVIAHSIQEINQKTDLNVSYEKIRNSRKVTEIKFNISRQRSLPTSDYYDNGNEETVLKTKEERQNEANQLLSDALTHPYTQQLLSLFLLNASDLTNKEIMIYLIRNVYSKYDLIKKEQGINALKHHLEYVHDHINDWKRHTNIAKYLEKAVNNYLNKQNLTF